MKSNRPYRRLGLALTLTRLRIAAISTVLALIPIFSTATEQEPDRREEAVINGWTVSDILRGVRQGNPTAIELAHRYSSIVGCAMARPQSLEKSGCERPIPKVDNPYYRDMYTWDSTMPVIHIRLWWHIVAENDGSNPAVAEQDVIDRMADLNQIYTPLGIQFQDTITIDSNSLQRYNISCTDLQCTAYDQLRMALLTDNLNYLNIIVTGADASEATWPVSAETFTTAGGIVMGIPPMTTTAWHLVVPHEVGHCLGLFHTFEGADPRFSTCSWACRENMSTGPGNSRGDMCYDTPPQPLHFQCPSEVATDACTGQSWASFDVTNIMGYGVCRVGFTSQQQNRMRATLFEALMAAHAINPAMDCDLTFGSDSLVVNLSARASAIDTPTGWSWDFDDNGPVSSTQNPTHSFSGPGIFQPTVEMSTAAGSYRTRFSGGILVEADTILGGEAEGYPGTAVRYDIKAHNFVPVRDMIIPVTWTGNLSLTFDSVSTAGLRSESLSASNLISYDPLNNRLVYHIQARDGDPIMSPDSAAVVSLYFTLDSLASVTESATVSFETISTFARRFSTIFNQYTPDAVPGTIRVKKCLVGDVDNSGEPSDIADLTYLISFMFKGGESPPNLSLADVNADSSIDVADVTYLVGYMFKNGPRPVGCS